MKRGGAEAPREDQITEESLDLLNYFLQNSTSLRLGVKKGVVKKSLEHAPAIS